MKKQFLTLVLVIACGACSKDESPTQSNTGGSPAETPTNTEQPAGADGRAEALQGAWKFYVQAELPEIIFEGNGFTFHGKVEVDGADAYVEASRGKFVLEGDSLKLTYEQSTCPDTTMEAGPTQVLKFNGVSENSFSIGSDVFVRVPYPNPAKPYTIQYGCFDEAGNFTHHPFTQVKVNN